MVKPLLPESGHCNASNPRSTVAVLAGGKSRRMGTDKAFLRVNGETLLEKVCGAALAAGHEVIIIGREQREVEPLLPGIKAYPDHWPDQGPLRGLETALVYTEPAEWIILSAVDLPAVCPACFEWLAAEAINGIAGDWDILLPELDDRIQPLFAVYRRRLLPTVQALLQEGRMAMHELIAAVSVRTIPLPPELLGAVADADSPADLINYTNHGKH